MCKLIVIPAKSTQEEWCTDAPFTETRDAMTELHAGEVMNGCIVHGNKELNDRASMILLFCLSFIHNHYIQNLLKNPGNA